MRLNSRCEFHSCFIYMYTQLTHPVYGQLYIISCLCLGLTAADLVRLRVCVLTVVHVSIQQALEFEELYFGDHRVRSTVKTKEMWENMI